jgi:hypothetical protein
MRSAVDSRDSGAGDHTDDGETGPPFVPHDLHAEYRGGPVGIVDEGLVAAHITLVEQKLD